MLLSIEPDGPVPIYQQIRDRIVEAIARGRQPAGSALPSTRQRPSLPRSTPPSMRRSWNVPVGAPMATQCSAQRS